MRNGAKEGEVDGEEAWGRQLEGRDDERGDERKNMRGIKR